ncbi:uncharacterized protein LOC110976722 isoform X2 [Acanthaster planci]|uniref:Uncharacterized protein LOC110976722 isoform X2 n=1 Tax=Acanthaster planci TaxID=133434 RepID=A0A8B7Y1V1_ACAPL|nr:uncharacterized protein LOC110976722 isoform X2 [Acanthaster planci]
MANVKVAVRVRPPSKKELDAGAINIIDVNEDVLSITNLKINSSEGDRHRERVKHYSFDHCYNSVDRQSDNYASQELIYQDLGTEVLNASFSGYNACLFAYGQTGSGKTYTVMGDDVDAGLIPRICEGMCSRVDDLEQGVTFKIEVSYLEIYNERVRDLLASSSATNYTLKVREHPKDGPYVQDLTKHMVSDFSSVVMLIAQGNRNRTTAATHMHEASSRSHAIFTLNFVQAKMVNNMPSEIVSKINLVDLAGSERANLNYSKGRLQEGANINKSLVTLGNCISALAENSMALSAASMESLALSEDGDFSSPKRRPGFIPYRNSVLTWLLKDSLGGNSRTIMIATISPSSTYFNETMSTLRYARRAKRIINQPFINEDPNVRLIRELRAEIDRLKALLNSASLSSSQASLVQDATISKMLAENEQKVDQLTEAWVDKWREAARIMQECNVGIRRESMGVIVESELPHLIGMDDDLLSTGIILYHLMEGETTIGREDSEVEQDIVLWGPGIECQHAVIVNQHGRVTLHPVNQSACAVNGNDIHQPTPLSQGAVVLLGKTNMFRFNHPAEAARLREKRASSIKPEDVEEIRRPRKNSVTLRVHNNLTAITEEGTRIRKISLSRETPPTGLDSPASLPRGRSLESSSTSPVPEVSQIMMYNPGVELERQHKIKVDKVESTRKRLEELQDKERRTHAAHKKEEERMKLAYEEHQQMIKEQRELLQRLREKHEKVKEETEKELEEMRECLTKEHEQGWKQLEQECQTLRRDEVGKASLPAMDDSFPLVIAKETDQSPDLSVLDVDRKRLAQMELIHKQSQRKAEAALERRQAAVDRQRSQSLRLIEQEERRLHEIECIPSLSDRFASASNDSLDSSLKSEDETGNGNETRAVIGWDRVSPIGGRSDSDSASGKAPSNSSDKEENGIDSKVTKKATPPSSSDRTGPKEPLPNRTTKPTSGKAQSSPRMSYKPQGAMSSGKPGPTSNTVFSRLYQQQAPKFEYLRRKPQRLYVVDQGPKRRNDEGAELRGRQRSLTDGVADVKARSNRLDGNTAHSISQRSKNQAYVIHNESGSSLKPGSKLRTKSASPRRLLEKGPKSRNSISPAEKKKDDGGKERTRSPPKTHTPKIIDHNSPTKCPHLNTKTEIKSKASGEKASPPRRTKTPSSESAIEKAMKRKPTERPKSASKISQEPTVSKEKSPPNSKDKAKANLPRVIEPISRAFEKLTLKTTHHSEAFFVALNEDNETSSGVNNKDQSQPSDLGDTVLEKEQESLDRQPAVGCSDSMEDVGSALQLPNLSSSCHPEFSVASDTMLDDSFSITVEEILSDSNESYPDSLEDAEEQEPCKECHEDSLDDGDHHLETSTKIGAQLSRRRKRGVFMELEGSHLITCPKEGTVNDVKEDANLVLQDSLQGTPAEEAMVSPPPVLLRENRSSDERPTSGYISENMDNHTHNSDANPLKPNVREHELLAPVELPQDAATFNEVEDIKEIKSRPDGDKAPILPNASPDMTVIDSGVSTDNNSITSDHTAPAVEASLNDLPTTNAADGSEKPDTNPATVKNEADNIPQPQLKTVIGNLASNDDIFQEPSLISLANVEYAPVVAKVSISSDGDDADSEEWRGPEDLQIVDKSDEHVTVASKEAVGLSIEDVKSPLKTAKHKLTSPSLIETEFTPESLLLTECSTKVVCGDSVERKSPTENMSRTLPAEYAADELRKAELSLPGDKCEDVPECKEITASPTVTDLSSVSQKSQGLPRKPVKQKDHSSLPLPHKTGKKHKKRRTLMKSKSSKKATQDREHFVSDGSHKKAHPLLPYLSLGASQDDAGDTRSQSSPFSSSLSNSSTTTFSSELSRSDSLQSRSPDDEVALISDGVSDPPDLSDKPATPTDFIVKPLPSPQTLAESVFWASSSSASNSGDEILEGDPVEPLEILENELDQSSELSINYDDDGSSGEEMAELGDLTIVADEQLDTVEGNSKRVLTTSSNEIPPVSLSDKRHERKGNSDGPNGLLAVKVSQGDPFITSEEEKCPRPHNQHEENALPDSTYNSQIFCETESSSSTVSDRPTRFISKLHIEPFQMSYYKREPGESQNPVSDGVPLSDISVHFDGIPIESSVRLEPFVAAASVTASTEKLSELLLPDANKTTNLPSDKYVETNSGKVQTDNKIARFVPMFEKQGDVRFMSECDHLELVEANVHSNDYPSNVSDDSQKPAVPETRSAMGISSGIPGRKSSEVISVELRKNMVPDGAIVETKADESQNVVLNRGKLVTEINPMLIQDELMRLRTLVNSLVIGPFALDLQELPSTTLDVSRDSAALKVADNPKGQESQSEDSQSSASPDSSAEELSIIEQLRGLSEKLGSGCTYPGEDTPDIIERARSLSDHLEQAHSSVYSPSLVEELRDLSRQLDASQFLTAEKCEEEELCFAQDWEGGDKSVLFQSAQDLTLYQTAFEVTQENLHPTPVGSLSLSPVQMQSTPVPQENDCTEFVGIVISPVVDPVMYLSRLEKSESVGDDDDVVFLKDSETQKSTFDVSDAYDIDSQPSDEDGAMDTAERVISEMSSFRLQLDILSGSDTVDDDDDDDDSSEDSNGEPTKGANNSSCVEDQKSHELPRKTRPPPSSRSSLECLLPTISEECLSSSDMDEPHTKPTESSPVGSTQKSEEEFMNLIPDDDTDTSGHPPEVEDPVHTVPGTSFLNTDEQIDRLNEPAIPIRFLTAVSKNLSDGGQQEASSLEEETLFESQSAHSQLLESEHPTVAKVFEPFVGKEFAATKAKLNMLVRVLGGNWESLGETSSEGSGASSPVQIEFSITPREQRTPTDDETSVFAINERIDSEDRNCNVFTYDESAQTDWLEEQDLASQTEPVHDDISTISEYAGFPCNSASGVVFADRFTQTTLSQKIPTPTALDLSLHCQSNVGASLLPSLSLVSVSSPSWPLCPTSVDGNTDNITKDRPAPHFFVEHDQLDSYPSLPQKPETVFHGAELVPLKHGDSASLVPTYSEKWEADRTLTEVSQPDSLQPPLSLLPSEPVVIKTSVVLKNEIIHFPPRQEDEPTLQVVSEFVEPTAGENYPSEEAKCSDLNGEQTNSLKDDVEKTSCSDEVPVEFLRKTTVVLKETQFVWPSLPQKMSMSSTVESVPTLHNNSKEPAIKTPVSPNERPMSTPLQEHEERRKLSPSSALEELVLGNADGSKDVRLTSPSMEDSKLKISDGNSMKEIPEIRLLGPVEEIFVKEAVTVSDKPVTWPLTDTNPTDKLPGQSCNPSDTNSLFQPIREESLSVQSSSQNPSSDNLLPEDESTKSPEHSQQLQIQSEHNGGDTSLNELKELSTAMGLSPQRSYSTDEELVQIFSKGVAHFRSRKQEIVKPELIAVATNTTPVKLSFDGHTNRVDAAVMTDVEIEQAHAYTSMSPDIDQELCFNQTTEIIPEHITPFAQLTASQLLSTIVDHKPKSMPVQQTNISNIENINTQAVLSSLHETESPSVTTACHNPVLNHNDLEQQNQAAVTPSSAHLTKFDGGLENSAKLYGVTDFETLELPSTKKSQGTEKSHVSEDSTLEDSVVDFYEEEQKLLNELRKRTCASQKAAKRAMACALKLRAKNLSDQPLEEALHFTTAPSDQQSETEIPKIRQDVSKLKDGSNQPDFCQENFTSSGRSELFKKCEADDKASALEDLHLVNEIVNQESLCNILPLEEFAQKLFQLVKEGGKEQISPPTKMISRARITLWQLNQEDCATDSEDSLDFAVHSPANHVEDPAETRHGASPHSQQTSLGAQGDDPEETNLDQQSQLPLPLVSENIQKEACCSTDFDGLALKVAKLEYFGPSSKPTEPQGSSDEKSPPGFLFKSGFLAEWHDTEPGQEDLSFLGSLPQETIKKYVPAFEVELVGPSELVQEKAICDPSSNDVKDKLAKLADSTEAENECTNNAAEIGATEDKKSHQNKEDAAPPDDKSDGSHTKPEDCIRRSSLKTQRPLLRAFSDISFDLDNDLDEDLRALKETNEKLDRIFAETSSLESDFEDKEEPELAGLVDEDGDSFIPRRSSAEGGTSFSSRLIEQPQKAHSAPADLIHKNCSDGNNEDHEQGEEEEEGEISSLYLRGILISPGKLEWLLADSESGNSSSRSSPNEKRDSPKMHKGLNGMEIEHSDIEGPQPSTNALSEHDNGKPASKSCLNETYEADTGDNNTQVQLQISNEKIDDPLTDQCNSETDNLQRPAEAFPKKDFTFSSAKSEIPCIADTGDLLALANSKPSLHTWPLKKSRYQPGEMPPSQELKKEIQYLKKGQAGNFEIPVGLVAYPLLKPQKDAKEPDSEGPDEESKVTADVFDNSLTQSSGIFSASTRDTELSYLRERRLSSEQLGSSSSETEDADLSRIHEEYLNILQDNQEAGLQPSTSPESTPTNIFTKTDEESPFGSSGQDESSEKDPATNSGNVQLGASWPRRVPISTKLDSRRDIAVELMEASLMYGIGETDAFLKFLESDLPLEEWKSPQITLRHRRSQSAGTPLLDAELSRHDPSPSKKKPRQMKHIPPQPTSLRSETNSKSTGSSPVPLLEKPGDSPASPSPSPNALPSQRRKFLQQLRSNIVSATSTQRPERAKIDALLHESWMRKDPRSTDSEQKRKPGLNADDIEALLEESRHMREKSRAEIAKAEENLSHAKPISRQDKDGRDTLTASQQPSSPTDRLKERLPVEYCSSVVREDGASTGARPKSVGSSLSSMQRLGAQNGMENVANHHQGSYGTTMKHRRPHSAHESLDMYNCSDAIEREIQCLRAASAAMSSRSPNRSPDLPSWRSLPLNTHRHTQPSPPPLQRHLPSCDRDASRHASPSYHFLNGEPARPNQGAASSQTRSPHPLAIPLIALHPPSPEEVDPSSIPAIARANEVLQASYRSSRSSSSQAWDAPPVASGPLQSSSSDPPVPSLLWGERTEASEIPGTQTSPRYSVRASMNQEGTRESASSPKLLPAQSSRPSLAKRRDRLDSPEAQPVKDSISSPPRRSGRHSRHSSQERLTQDLPPIIETPLVTLDTLYHLAADQAMAHLIRETTLIGKADAKEREHTAEQNGWRYQRQEKDIVLWQKSTKYCSFDSFLGLSVLKAPAQTIFNLISNSARYSCLHEAITNVKLLEYIDNTVKVACILCDTDKCSLQKSRDFCCVIKQTFQDGKWYIAATSVNHPLCPTVSSAVRGQILCCGISMEPVLTDDGEHCMVSYLSQIDLQGDLKPTLVNHLTSQLPLCLAHLRGCVEIGQL